MVRIFYYDLLNVLACFAVIVLHHNSMVHHFTPNTSWSVSLGFEVLFYWAVPVFFMLSGATLMDYRKKYSSRNFLIHRLKRTFIPFIIWNIIFYFIYIRQEHTLDSPLLFLDKLSQGGYCDAYWFFIPLFSLYLLLPLLSLAADRHKLLLYLSLLSIFLCSFVKPCFRLLEINDCSLINNAILMPIMYAFVGYVLSHDILKIKLIWISLFAFTSLLFRYIVTYTSSFEINEVYRFWFSYDYFTALFPAMFVFLLIKRFGESLESNKICSLITTISRCTFGIYLIHKLVMKLEMSLFHLEWNDCIWSRLCVFATFVLCLFIVLFVKKIPYIGSFIFP